MEINCVVWFTKFCPENGRGAEDELALRRLLRGDQTQDPSNQRYWLVRSTTAEIYLMRCQEHDEIIIKNNCLCINCFF